MAVTPDALREALRAIKDPASGRDIVSAGLVEGIEQRGGLVQVSLLTDRAHAAAMEPVRQEAEALLARQPGVTNATAVLTAHNAGPAGTMPRPAAAGGRPVQGPVRRRPRMARARHLGRLRARMVGTATGSRVGSGRRCCCRM